MKFEIFQSEKNEKFYFRLKAKNGQVILQSQGYADKGGCKKGISSVQKNATEDARYDKKESSNGKFFFNLCAKNNEIIGSSQLYASKATRANGISAVKKVAPEAVIVDLSA